MALMGLKLGGKPVGRSAGVLWIRMGALFLGSSKIHLNLLSWRERLPRTSSHERVHVVCIRFLL
jgi:hypothetical protein